MSTSAPKGFPAGWWEDTHAPFPTFYNAEGILGVTQDEDSTQWFPVAYDEAEEIVKPLALDGALMDWDTRPPMYDTPQEALTAALRSSTK